MALIKRTKLIPATISLVGPASQVLVATGRRPYTEGLGLEAVGIKKDRLGRVQVDGDFRTAVPSVYAIGE